MRQHRRLWIFLAFLFFVCLPSLRSQEESQLAVFFEGEEARAALSTVRRDGVVYASLGELADLLTVKYFHNVQNKKMVLRVGARAIKVTAMSPFVVVDDKVYQLALPTVEIGKSIFVPLALFLDVVGGLFPAETDFDGTSSVLRVRRLRYNITGVEVEDKLNGFLIRFVTTRNFKASDVATSFNRGWLNVTLYGGVLDSARVASEKPMGIVKRIVPFQFESSAQVSFLLDQDVVDQKVYVDEGEVLVSLRSSRMLDAASLVSPEEDRRRWLIDRIIIDPGHGGKDPGAVGKRGVKEKEVNLDVAQRLQKLLQKNLRVDVLLTREGDSFVKLEDRTRFANANGGKLCISIHADGNKNSRVRGFSSYFLGVAKTQKALEVAQRENSVIALEESTEGYEEFKDAAHILNAIAQNSYVKESQDLARIVNESFKKRLKIPDLGVHQAGFYVLIGAAMPSILVETGFLSNAYEERLLRTRSFRQKVAEALYESIQKFKEEYEKGIS